MAHLTVKPGADGRLERDPRILAAIRRRYGEPIQDNAARITAAEAVDTGLMAASWRIRTTARSVQVGNTAHSPEGFPYPAAVEFGYRHHSGRHMPARRILARAIDLARHRT